MRLVGPESAERIAASREVQICALIATLNSKPLLSNHALVDEYLRTRLAHLGREQVRVLFVDKPGRLIADELVCDGTVDEAAIFPRELVRRALELDASGFILAHNHPSRDSKPSSADIRVTQTIRRAADCLNVTLIDHIIVGASNFSMRAAGLLG